MSISIGSSGAVSTGKGDAISGVTTLAPQPAYISEEVLQAGKHVLVEKPLCMSMQELKTIGELCLQSDRQLTVGFNRRFSPLTQAIKDSLRNVTTPKFIIYRINAGHIPKHVWVQDLAIGGGRIIGG